jgi:ComF family protein
MTMSVLEPLLKAFFPPRCPACGDFVETEASLCAVCQSSWPALQEPFCGVCAEPFVAGPCHRCGRCLEDPPSFERLSAAGLYEGFLLDLIVRLKYRGEERLAELLGRRMSEALPGEGGPFDFLIPVPLHVSRLRERGFNQAVLLAKVLQKTTRAPVDPFLLKKDRPTPPQATLKLEERKRNVRGVFRVAEPARVEGRSLLLVDDVATTGATLDEAARVLKRAGAKRVEAVVAARAPR